MHNRSTSFSIMEGINLMNDNQMALHTTAGCVHSTPPNQRGQSGELDCSQPSGCLVGETMPNSYQTGFAAAGGGVFATQFDVSGLALPLPLPMNPHLWLSFLEYSMYLG
jgi:hypothetical protein